MRAKDILSIILLTNEGEGCMERSYFWPMSEEETKSLFFILTNEWEGSWEVFLNSDQWMRRKLGFSFYSDQWAFFLILTNEWGGNLVFLFILTNEREVLPDTVIHDSYGKNMYSADVKSKGFIFCMETHAPVFMFCWQQRNLADLNSIKVKGGKTFQEYQLNSLHRKMFLE